MECGSAPHSSIEERENIKTVKNLKLQPFTFALLLILVLIYLFIIIVFHISSTLSTDVIALSVLGLVVGAYGLLKPYPVAIYLSILISGLLAVIYSSYDGDIFYIVLISTVIVAFYYGQHFLMYASRILQGIKGGEAVMHTKKVVRNSILKVLFIATSTFLTAFILLNLSVLSSIGFTSVWTVFILAVLFIILTSLLITIPKKEAG